MRGRSVCWFFSGGGVKGGLMHGGEKKEEVVGGRGGRSEGAGYLVSISMRSDIFGGVVQ